MCESMDKNRILGSSAGRAGNLPRSPYPSRVRSVDPATVHRRRLSLPQEICSVSLRRLRLSKGGLTAGQKSAEGILARIYPIPHALYPTPQGDALFRPGSKKRLPRRRDKLATNDPP